MEMGESIGLLSISTVVDLLKEVNSMLLPSEMLKELPPETTTSLLPAEMLYSVFQFLTPKDLKSVVLVCRRWREVGENPRLWSKIRIVVCKDNISRKRDIQDCMRLRMVRELEIRAVRVIQPVLQLTGLHTLDMWWPRLSLPQLHTLFVFIAKKSQLKSLRLDSEDISTLRPGLLVRAVTKLETVCLQFTKITTFQINSICEEIGKKSRCSNLRSLDIGSNNLSKVDPFILAKAAGTLEILNISDTGLTTIQITKICSQIVNGCNLKSLNIEFNKVTEVNPKLLSTAVNKLEKVDLTQSCMTSEQTRIILLGLEPYNSLRNLRIDIFPNNAEEIVRFARAKEIRLIPF